MLKVYNTLSRKKEIFKPINKDWVGFYHCGPTVYWIQHLGNMRAVVIADLVYRTLKYLGYSVKMARNYTDVGHLTSDQDEGEDKIEKTAKSEKKTPQEIAQKYIDIFERNVKDLNILDPDYKPRATKCIDQMIKMIKVLLKKGYAYQTDLAIYFDTSKAKNYTRLSGQKLEEQIKGSGKGNVADPDKKHPSDFSLWFFKTGVHKRALQTWPSPFGQGFPGWHIECSVMAKKYLGDTIDIHMGGVEHIPIHHTNEIAQSEAANGVKFVNYWLHNEHLLVNNKKMSKSEGTGYTLSQIEEKGFNPLALRYLFLQSHYRSKQNFTFRAMEAAQKGFDNLVSQIRSLGNKQGKVNPGFKKEFQEKISDDFNSPQSLTIIQEVLKSDLSNEDKLATLLDFDKVLGLKLDKIKKGEIPSDVKELAKRRETARDDKDFKESDRIRKEIEAKGWKIKDRPEGPELSPE